MNSTVATLTALFDRIPRRHSPENIKEIVVIMSEYENVLMEIESINTFYEKQSAIFFEDLEQARAGIKKSDDKKASKKNKDDYFQDASGMFKQSIERLIAVYGDGSKTD